MTKVAFITGITGQDGAYLAELLLKKGYVVHGLKRRSSLFNTDRIDHLYQDPHVSNRNFVLHHGDLTDSTNLIRIIQQVQPDEIYNLAAMSHVAVNFDTPNTPPTPTALVPCASSRRSASWAWKKDALLSGINLRALRPRAGNPAKGNDALLPAQPIRGGQALQLLDHRELP